MSFSKLLNKCSEAHGGVNRLCHGAFQLYWLQLSTLNDALADCGLRSRGLLQACNCGAIGSSNEANGCHRYNDDEDTFFTFINLLISMDYSNNFSACGLLLLYASRNCDNAISNEGGVSLSLDTSTFAPDSCII